MLIFFFPLTVPEHSNPCTIPPSLPTLAEVNSVKMALAFPEGKAETEDCIQLPVNAEHELN